MIRPDSSELYSSMLVFAGALFIGPVASCGSDTTAASECEAGTAGCECVVGTCAPGLACNQAQGICIFDPGGAADSPEEPSPQREEEAHASAESKLCKRLDECNLMTPGWSVQDCTDFVTMCTSDLLTSEKVDWSNQAAGCLGFANCQNFSNCYDSIDRCGAVEPCAANCDVCWLSTEREFNCPLDWEGDGECDCGCQFADTADCST